ncbi:MAG: hypothetical protein P0S94_00015 [Simkaniaceae bacterium]|nr:hypothetical protein [Simkaniaceae bacterium]
MELHNLPIFYDDSSKWNVRGYLDLLTTISTRQYIQVTTADGENTGTIQQLGWGATIARALFIATLVLPLFAQIGKCFISHNPSAISLGYFDSETPSNSCLKIVVPSKSTTNQAVTDFLQRATECNDSVVSQAPNDIFQLDDGSTKRGEEVNGCFSGIKSTESGEEYIVPHRLELAGGLKFGEAYYNIGDYRAWDGEKFIDQTLLLVGDEEGRYQPFEGAIDEFAEIIFQNEPKRDGSLVDNFMFTVAQMLFVKEGEGYPIEDLDDELSFAILLLYDFSSKTQDNAITLPKECAQALYQEYSEVSEIAGKLKAAYPDLS